MVAMIDVWRGDQKRNITLPVMNCNNLTMIFCRFCCLRSRRRIEGGIPLEARTNGVCRKERCHDRAENPTILEMRSLEGRKIAERRKDKRVARGKESGRCLKFIVWPISQRTLGLPANRLGIRAWIFARAFTIPSSY